MMRGLLLLVLAGPFCASAVSLTAVELHAGEASIPALVGGPKGAPAVIVIQEWWGVTPQIRAHALRIAKEGYRVLIPDVYKGELGADAEEAHHLMSGLDFPAAVGEIASAASHLKAEGSPRVGVVGFCMGGALAMGSLAASADIVCGAPFYGVNFGLFDAAALADKPVQGHFGMLDSMTGFSDPSTGKKLEADLLAAGNARAKVFLYEGVGHAFMNDSPAPFESFEARTEKMGFPGYDSKRAELAWDRLLSFFDDHLKPQGFDVRGLSGEL